MGALWSHYSVGFVHYNLPWSDCYGTFVQIVHVVVGNDKKITQWVLAIKQQVENIIPFLW